VFLSTKEISFEQSLKSGAVVVVVVVVVMVVP